MRAHGRRVIVARVRGSGIRKVEGFIFLASLPGFEKRGEGINKYTKLPTGPKGRLYVYVVRCFASVVQSQNNEHHHVLCIFTWPFFFGEVIESSWKTAGIIASCIWELSFFRLFPRPLLGLVRRTIHFVPVILRLSRITLKCSSTAEHYIATHILYRRIAKTR